MARFVCEFPDHAPEKDNEDELLKSLQQKGFTYKAKLETELTTEDKNMLKINTKKQKTLAATMVVKL